MPSFSGIAQGIGGEAPQIEKGRLQKRKEALENLGANLDIDAALQRRRQMGIEETNAQTRLKQLQMVLDKMEEWKTVGQPKQMSDGTWAQMQFQPSSSQTRFVPVPAPDGGQFQTPDQIAGAKAAAQKAAQARVFDTLRKAGVSEDAIEAAFPGYGQIQFENTQQGIIGLPKRMGQLQQNPGGINTGRTGWPPSYGYGAALGPSSLDQTDRYVVDQLIKGNLTQDMLDKMYPGTALQGKRRVIITEAIKGGYDPNAQLSGPAAQVVATFQGQIDSNQAIIDDIDRLGLGGINTRGYLAWARIKYGTGEGTPGGLADDIANLELTRVTSAAAAIKGSSRSLPALERALKHTPNVLVDSPMLIRQKLKTINDRLQKVIEEERRFGTKSGMPSSRGTIDLNNVTGTVEPAGGPRKELGGQTKPRTKQ